MLRTVLEALLAGCLLVAAAAKLASPRASIAALATYGLRTDAARRAGWAAVLVAEALLAAGILAGVDAAAPLAAAMMAGFAAALALALRAGRAGAPCGCLGARSQVGRPALLRALGLGAVAAAIPFLPTGSASTEAWLALGLVVALAGVGALGIAVLALAREVGELRMSLPSRGALEIPEEGPPVGSRAPLSPAAPAEWALAVFTSEGCPVCRTLEPAVRGLSRDPLVSVEVFDEVRDASVWEALGIPGSPFAVALDADGVVRAKGTFNTPAQLEGILGTGERRRASAFEEALGA